MDGRRSCGAGALTCKGKTGTHAPGKWGLYIFVPKKGPDRRSKSRETVRIKNKAPQSGGATFFQPASRFNTRRTCV
jgi:hypothetical protein